MKKQSMRPPTRLIDVGSPNESKDPRLSLDNDQVHTWVALSYCWGGQSDFVLNDLTMDSMIDGVPLSNFPPTLQDAVSITRRLGIRYLWVDALCIKQDSRVDWLQESSKMRNVYKGATLTLIAANASTVNTGIFSKRYSEVEPCPFPWNVSGEGPGKSRSRTVYMRPAILNLADTEPEPIQERGWTLQEDLLSPRALSYSAHCMTWECATHRIDEGGTVTLPDQSIGKAILQEMLDNNSSKKPPWMSWDTARKYFLCETVHSDQGDPNVVERFLPGDRYERWWVVVQEYTRRHLTNEMDYLPGLSGLASEFSLAMRDTYLAGLWRKELLRELMWNLYLGPDPEDGVIPIAPPALYRAPSWCWASINGPGIHMNYRSEFLHDLKGAYEYAKIVDVKVKPVVGSDPFGQVQAGYLILRARFWPIKDPLEDRPASSTNALPAVHRFLQKSIQETEEIKQEFNQQHQPCSDQRFALLQLMERNRSKPDSGAEYLVLETTTAAASIYRRVCFISLSKKPDSTVGSRARGPEFYEDDRFDQLEKDALRELQAATVKKKTVKIV